MARCGADAHPHVRTCPRRLSADLFFGSVEEFERSNRSRRQLQLDAYLATLPATLSAELVRALRVQLRDLGMAAR